jgi:hypothetical protein
MTRGTLISFQWLDSPSRALSGDSAKVVTGLICRTRLDKIGELMAQREGGA